MKRESSLVRHAKGAGGGRMKRRACWTLEAAKAVTKPHSGALGGVGDGLMRALLWLRVYMCSMKRAKGHQNADTKRCIESRQSRVLEQRLKSEERDRQHEANLENNIMGLVASHGIPAIRGSMSPTCCRETL
jgi:hypothetical protein